MIRRNALLLSLLILFVVSTPLHAQSEKSSESLGKAEINRIINDVFTVEDIRREKPRIHSSKEGEVLGQYHAVRTAEQARAELIFSDGSLARVGSDAYFSFSSSERDVQMGKGTALFQVPKNSDETNVQTATATASLTGTTLMVNQQPGNHVKAAVIEGSVDVSMPDRAGESRSLQAGEMIVMPTDAQRLPEPVDVDLQELVRTSGLINGFDEEEEEDGSEEDDGAEAETEDSDETSDSTEETDETGETTDESTEGTEKQTESPDETEGEAEGDAKNAEGEGPDEVETEIVDLDLTGEASSDASEGEGSSLNMDQLSEGIEQQRQEIESGELEETNMVIDGEGTEVTLENEADLETETTTGDNKDAVEQKSDDQTTLTLDGTKEVYLGKDNDQNPPTADGLEGEIITPSSSINEEPSPSSTDEAFLEAALLFLNGGMETETTTETALFESDVIEVDGEPTVRPTEFVQDVAFFARDTINFNIDQLIIDGSQNSVGIGAGADDYRLDLPDLDIETATQFGAITVGDGSELRFGNVGAPGSFVTGFSRGDISAASGSTLSAGSLNMTSLTGSLTLDNNLLEAQHVSLLGFSPQSSITALNGSDIRTVDPAGSVQLFALGGNVSVQNSTLGYYNSSDAFYDPTAGSVILSTLNTNDPGSLDVTGSELLAGEVTYSVGAGDASLTDSTLSAQNDSRNPALSGHGNLTTDNAQLESASNLSLSSQATSGQSFSITNSTQLQTLSAGGAVTLVSQGGDVEVANSRLGYNEGTAFSTAGDEGTAFSTAGGIVTLDSFNPDASATVDITHDGDFPTGTSWGPSDVDMMAETIKARAHGPNGELLIDGSFMAASAGLQLYAPGSDGTVRFTGNSRIDLGGTAGAALAGNTVQVDNGVDVIVSGSDLTEVYANNYNFRHQARSSGSQGCGDGSAQCGEFVNEVGDKIFIEEYTINDSGDPSRPAFK